MPLAGGDVNERAARDHVDHRGQGAGIVIEVLLEMSPQAHHRLGCSPMPMDGQHRPRLDGIEHPLRLILRRIPQVQVHPETRRCLGLGGQGIEGMLVDNYVLHLPGLLLNRLLDALHDIPYILILHIRTGREAEANLEDIFLKTIRVHRCSSIYRLLVHRLQGDLMNQHLPIRLYHLLHLPILFPPPQLVLNAHHG